MSPNISHHYAVIDNRNSLIFLKTIQNVHFAGFYSELEVYQLHYLYHRFLLKLLDVSLRTVLKCCKTDYHDCVVLIVNVTKSCVVFWYWKQPVIMRHFCHIWILKNCINVLQSLLYSYMWKYFESLLWISRHPIICLHFSDEHIHIRVGIYEKRVYLLYIE